MTNIHIHGVGTAVPEHACGQEEVRQVVGNLFAEVDKLDRLLRVFDHLHIHKRHFVRDIGWYAEDHGFAETNAVFAESAVQLSRQAAVQAMRRAGIEADAIGGIIVASSTGLMTPSLDAVLIQELGLPLDALRLPLFGLGCAGGVAGLARAAELSAARAVPMLFVAVEISSVTLQRNDISKANLIGTSLFADGAAAVVVGPGGAGPEIRASFHQLFTDTYDIMGWDFTDTGMKVRFARSIPDFVRRHIPAAIAAACRKWGIGLSEIVSFVTHPGGAKVLEAFAEVVGRGEEVLATSQETLRNYGNMSSPTVLFVLDSMLTRGELLPGYTLMSALGPGFSFDQLLLRTA